MISGGTVREHAVHWREFTGALEWWEEIIRLYVSYRLSIAGRGRLGGRLRLVVGFANISCWVRWKVGVIDIAIRVLWLAPGACVGLPTQLRY